MGLKPNQFITVIPYGKNIQYYTSLGYEFNYGDSIVVPAEQLPKCKIKVKVICDCCGKEYEVEYKFYLNATKKHDGKLYCYDCYNNDLQILKLRQDKKITGVKKKYGVDNVFELQEVKDKIKNTCMIKYNCENPMQNPDILKKVENTNLKKYGYKVALNNSEIYLKAQETLYQHGTQKCSKQQYSIFEMILNIYSDKYTECALNKPVSSCSADISLIINDIKIDIEYDGSYWHQDPQKDRRRDEVFKSLGYKILRIKSKKLIPTYQQLQEQIDLLLNNDKSYFELILDDYNK